VPKSPIVATTERKIILSPPSDPNPPGLPCPPLLPLPDRAPPPPKNDDQGSPGGRGGEEEEAGLEEVGSDTGGFFPSEEEEEDASFCSSGLTGLSPGLGLKNFSKPFGVLSEKYMLTSAKKR
jgi:hypothetical protein